MQKLIRKALLNDTLNVTNEEHFNDAVEIFPNPETTIEYIRDKIQVSGKDDYFLATLVKSMPCVARRRYVMLCDATCCHTMPSDAMQCHVTPCDTFQRHAMPCPAM